MTSSTKPKSAVPAKGRAPARKTGSNSNVGLWIVGGGVLLVVLVVALLWMNQRGTTTGAGAATVAAPDVPAEWIDGATIGDPAAPVVIQAWEDFLCPACQQWTRDVEPQLLNDFIKTGKARLEFHQFPLQQHAPGAQMASQASLCAADQNMFWPYHDRLFQAASTRGQAGLEIRQLTTYAREVGLDEARFTQCMNNQEMRNAMAESLTQAQQLGLNSTPSVLVNGQLIASPFDYNSLMAAIEAATPAN
jgi:protein-disulfide isomerase